MENNIKKRLPPPAYYSLPLRFLFSFLRIINLYLGAWWYGGHCVIGSSVRVKSSTLFQGQGTLVVYDRVTLGYSLAGAVGHVIVLQPREGQSVIEVGENAAIMNGCELIALKSIKIGADCRIGPHTLIYDSDFHDLAPDRRSDPGNTAEVCLEDNVWVGSRSIILKGVTIGKDAVVAAGSVVTKNVVAGSIVAGNPARQIGSVYEKRN